jgi:hypothetical protein
MWMEKLTIDLMLKGGGCKRRRTIFRPIRLGAGRTWRAAKSGIDAVQKPRTGCAGILGVAIGGIGVLLTMHLRKFFFKI